VAAYSSKKPFGSLSLFTKSVKFSIRLRKDSIKIDSNGEDDITDAQAILVLSQTMVKLPFNLIPSRTPISTIPDLESA
jgi:hypothetical protein